MAGSSMLGGLRIEATAMATRITRAGSSLHDGGEATASSERHEELVLAQVCS